MTYEGWLSFGGNEVVNSERLRGYAETSDCPPNWFRGDRCKSLADALSDDPYSYANIPLAPWYDPSLADVSSRFMGVQGLSIQGLDDSTRSASSTEGIDDGGTLGRTRKGMRNARVRASLIAQGRDALEYGVSWLNAALDPGACGQHGSRCGTTDVEYFADCPPARAEIEEFTEWEELRRNLIARPTPVDASDWNISGGALDSVFTRRLGVPTLRHTLTVAFPVLVSNAVMLPSGFSAYTDGIPVVEGETYTVSAYASASVAGFESVVSIIWATAAGAPISSSNGAFVTGGVVGQWQRPSTTAIAPAGAAFGIPALAMLASPDTTAPIGTHAWMTDGLMEVGSTVGEFIAPGVIPNTETRHIIWTGEPNESASVEETRTELTRPQTDEEYAEVVDPLRRFLHDVSVTSGPILIDIFESKSVKGLWGATFEWTITSERPWIYSPTRPVDLPITQTVVMESTPFNLVPHPSMALAGDAVSVSTNLATNPSVETDISGWGARRVVNGVKYAGVGSQTPPARSTAVAASGVASYLTRADGYEPNATDMDYTMESFQIVDLSEATPGARFSFSIWGHFSERVVSAGQVRVSLGAYIEWLPATGETPISTVNIGETTTNFSGETFSAKALVKPPTATRVRVVLSGRFTAVAGGDMAMQMFADALAVTVP